YQKALQLRRKIDAKSSNWEDRLALARAYRLVANPQWATGNHGETAMNTATAVTISEALSIGHPKNLKILHELRFDYEVAGDIPASGDPGGTEGSRKQDQNYHKAIDTDELMLALSPDDFDVQHAYATDLVNLGGILTHHEKDLKAALACFQKELGIDQRLRE